jgi:hypothetical protein
MKKPLSFEEHQDRGLKLQQAYEFVLSFSVEIARAYGQKSAASKSLDGAVDALRASKNALDDIVCKDFSNKPPQDQLHCYFAKSRSDGSKTTPRTESD